MSWLKTAFAGIGRPFQTKPVGRYGDAPENAATEAVDPMAAQSEVTIMKKLSNGAMVDPKAVTALTAAGTPEAPTVIIHLQGSTMPVILGGETLEDVAQQLGLEVK